MAERERHKEKREDNDIEQKGRYCSPAPVISRSVKRTAPVDGVVAFYGRARDHDRLDSEREQLYRLHSTSRYALKLIYTIFCRPFSALIRGINDPTQQSYIQTSTNIRTLQKRIPA